jgi:hypothetical protein
MDTSPSLGNRRRSLRSLRTNPERLSDCGHDLMHFDPSSDRDLKCDICWRNRETLIARFLEPFERAFRVEPEELQRILREEQAERDKKAEAEQKAREKRDEERRRKEEESKKKRERMRAMQEARRGKGGKFEKKPKVVDPPPVAAAPEKETPGKRRGENGKFLKSSSVESRDPSMTPSFTQSFSPGVSATPSVDVSMREVSQESSAQIKVEEGPQFEFSFPPPEKAVPIQAAVSEEVAEEQRRVDQPRPESTIAPPEQQITVKPAEPPVAIPQRKNKKAQPAPPTTNQIFTFHAEPNTPIQPAGFYAVSQPVSQIPIESHTQQPKPIETISSAPFPPKRLRSRSRTSSVAIPPPPAPPAAAPRAPPVQTTEEELDSIRVQSTPVPTTRRRSISASRSANSKVPNSPAKPKQASKQMKSKSRRLSNTATVTPPAPPQLRFVHTAAPASHMAAVSDLPDKAATVIATQQPLQQRTLFSFFRPNSIPTSGSASPMATATPVTGSVASNPGVTLTTTERETKRSARGREAIRQLPPRPEDPNRRKSTRNAAVVGRVNYCESSDEEDDEEGVGV